jgi:hypothetical protein
MFFFDCPLIKDCINRYLRLYGNPAEMNNTVGEKKFIFAGTAGEWRESSLVDAVQNIIFYMGFGSVK